MIVGLMVGLVGLGGSVQVWLVMCGGGGASSFHDPCLVEWPLPSVTTGPHSGAFSVARANHR